MLQVSAAVAPRQTEAVARATDRHLSLYEKIAEEHRRIGAEQYAARLAFEATSVRNEYAEGDYAQYPEYQKLQH